MKFKLYEKVELKTKKDFYEFWEFVEEHTNAKINTFYVNGGDNIIIRDDFIILDQLWIEPKTVSNDNIVNIMNLLDYIEKYSNTEITIADINVR